MDSHVYLTRCDLLDYEKASKKAMIYLINLLNIYCKDKSFGWMMADRIKSLESINNKISKKIVEKGAEFDPRLDLLDIAGLRVVFCDKSNIYPFIEDLDNKIHNWSSEEFISEFEKSKLSIDNYSVSNLYDFVDTLARSWDRVIIVKDYIKYQKESGYQSLHVIINVPIQTRDNDNNSITRYCPVEIQFRNFTQHLYNECEHDFYKGRRNDFTLFKNIFDECKKFLFDVSRDDIEKMLSCDKQYLIIRKY